MEKQLLTLFLELYVLNNKPETWSLEKFADHQPSSYRLQMINSLMKALEINCTYVEFIKGRFISEVQLNKWSKFKKSIQKYLSLKEEDNAPKFPTQVNDIKSIFLGLMDYRLNAQIVLSTNDGIYATSGDFEVFVNVMNNCSRKLYRELKKIDIVLLFCINPNSLSCTKKELINNFGFPKVNITAIDIDWM
jgi:hypothetical protein